MWIYIYCLGLSCDESGTIIVGSCSKCPYELYFDEWDFYYDIDYYDNYYNDGTYCSGDCSWNSDLDECQLKGIFLMTKVYLPLEEGSHIFLMTF